MVVIIPVLAVLGRGDPRSRVCSTRRTTTSRCSMPRMRLIGAYIVVRVGVLLFAASLGNQVLDAAPGKLGSRCSSGWRSRPSTWAGSIPSSADSTASASPPARAGSRSGRFLKLLFTLTLFVLVAAWISRWVDRRLKKLSNLAPSTRIGLAKFANAFLIGLSILMGLNAAGVDLTALTVLTGAIGLGLGFGLQSIAANFVSGFVLLMDRSIKPGDVISLSGQSGTSTENFGWVQELRGRYVVVRDRDGIEMLVPNQQLISNAVINWSYTDPRIRLKLPVRVSYQRRSGARAARFSCDACEGQRRVLRDPPPVSRLMQFGDHGIELELRFWISDPQEGVNNVRSEVNRTIWALVQGAQDHDTRRAARDPDAQRARGSRLRCRRAARSLRANRDTRRGVRVEIRALLRTRRTERQQGRERGAAALLAAAEYQPAGSRRRNRLRRLAGQRLIDDGSILIARAQRTQPGAKSPRGARAAGGSDPRRPDRAQDPQENPADARLEGAPHRIEEAPRQHQAARGARAWD